MSSDDRNSMTQALESLRQAIEMLEQTAAREAAERNAKASASAADTTRLGEAVRIVSSAIAEAARSRPEVRSAIAELARWLSELAGESNPKPAQQQHAPKTAEPVRQTGTGVSSEPRKSPTQQIPLMLGGAPTVLQVPGTEQEAEAARQAAERTRNSGWSASPSSPVAAPGTPIDLGLLASRCRTKAEGCEWAAQYRDRWDEEPEDGELRRATYHNIISRAKALPNCYVWALNTQLTLPGFRRLLDYAQGYRNLANAAELAGAIHRDGPHGGEWLAEALALLAEAQSAIRAALITDGLFTDADQEDAFRWLRTRTSEDRILVARHMKLDDPADLSLADDLAARIDGLRSRVAEVRQQDSKRRSLLAKARYHARQLSENQTIDPEADWRKLIDSLTGAVARGVPPSDVEIRDILVPVIDQLPEGLDLPPDFERIMEAIDVYLATREAEGTADSRPRSTSREVEEVASLLEGQVVVLIGGQCRAEAKRALERDLRLAELRWIPAAHHQSHYLFESAIARPETALVMIAIRWSSHSFENVDELCRKYGKPFVRLPGGYSPNQVAKQILIQVSDQLKLARQR